MFDWFKRLFKKKEKQPERIKMYVEIPIEEIKLAPFDYSQLNVNPNFRDHIQKPYDQCKKK
ncbi:hypothetical protein D5018_10020 [Parashewanella curva]|uniref:Uncharacterized protein n=1 Tax=Parashewanella curva TaxID=2338552 RepID=A0A3L8Q0B5_9GAMM|nr:hypothetical protein [Parashewanella curva]RLV59802.1 hypothetical protein D5018_10020 [Parashewanella curva]